MMSDNFSVDKGCTKMRSRELLVDTTKFSDNNLEEFLNISEKIERVTRERRSQRKCSNSIVSTNTRREIFQSINKNDDEVLEKLGHQISYEDNNADRASLATSIDNLMTYFGEDMKVVNDSFGNPSSVEKNPRGKVACALSSIQNKRNMAMSSLSKCKEQLELNVNVNELKKKYETFIETKSSSAKMVEVESLKFLPEISVKQLVLFYNNKSNQVVKNTSPELKSPQPLSPSLESVALPHFTSTPELKTKSPNFVFKIPSSVSCNPFFGIKRVQKSPKIISLTDILLGKKTQLQTQCSTTCFVDELSVKDKVLFYNKFIENSSKQNSDLCGSKIPNIKKEVHCREEVILESQSPVNHLRDIWEKRFLPFENRSETLQRFKRSPLSDVTQKYNISTLPSSEKIVDLKKSNSKVKDGSKKDEKAFNTNTSETSLKRTQSIIRSSFPVEPYAPPQKLRKRIGDECLAPKLFFQNKHLEDEFYNWLNEKNGMEFDIKLINNRGDIEIVPKNRDDIILPNKVKKIPKASEFVKNMENNTGVTKHNNVALINNTINDKSILKESVVKVELPLEVENSTTESEKSETDKGVTKDNNAAALINNTINDKSILKESVVEVELPLEVENSTTESKKSGTEDSGLGLASVKKSTSEESHPELKPKEVSDPRRKKKLRQPFMLENSVYILQPKAIFSTDSDSDFRYRKSILRNYTYPKLRNCSSHVKRLIFKILSNITLSLKRNKCINYKTGTYNIYLDRYLEKKVNSPTKLNKAYTLAVMSSPSSCSQGESNDSDLSKTSKKVLPDIKIDEDTNSTKSIDLKDGRKKLFTESSADQGFETGANETESSLRWPTLNSSNIENSLDTNKSFIKRQNPKNFSTPNKDKPVKEAFAVQLGLTDHNDIISPISRNCSILKSPASLTMAVMEDPKELQRKESDGANLNLANAKTDYQLELGAKLTVPEMLKDLQKQKIKLKSLEERILHCIDVDPQIFKGINKPPEYVRKLNNIISSVDHIRCGSGYDTCTIDQLENFSFLLYQYGDICLDNCIDRIEKILDVIVKRSSSLKQ